MKIKLLGVVFGVFSIFSGHAQVGGASRNLKQQAEKMGVAFVHQDFATVAKYTYPVILKAMGGADKMGAAISSVMSNMKAQGMSFTKVSFEEPSTIVKSGGELQATIPQRTDIKLKQGRLVSKSTIIAISNDNGVNWTFLDTSNKNMATIKQVLPSLSPSITIPEQQAPVKYND